jgi:hypothetical protein
MVRTTLPNVLVALGRSLGCIQVTAVSIVGPVNGFA